MPSARIGEEVLIGARRSADVFFADLLNEEEFVLNEEEFVLNEE